MKIQNKADIRVSQLKLDNSLNAQWHSKNKLSQSPSLDQRVNYHIEHARRCPCNAPQDEDILLELKKRFTGKHQDFWIEHNINDHRVLGSWASECADHVLPYFEEKHGRDTRPRDAITVLRKWAETGEFRMSIIRAAALSAHAAAKMVDAKASYAAHAAGQAVATAHVPTHAIGTVAYTIKIAALLNPNNVKKAVFKVREWQNERLPDNLKPWVDAWVKRITALLPKDLRAKLS